MLWHNPRCSTSRAALAMLRARGIEPAFRLYLDEAPTQAELEELLVKLGVEPHDVIRTKEPEYSSLGLSRGGERASLVNAIVTHPRLLERPILVVGERAVIGRPAERVLDILPEPRNPPRQRH